VPAIMGEASAEFNRSVPLESPLVARRVSRTTVQLFTNGLSRDQYGIRTVVKAYESKATAGIGTRDERHDCGHEPAVSPRLSRQYPRWPEAMRRLCFRMARVAELALALVAQEMDRPSTGFPTVGTN
jgi:hypothetical protein